MVKNHYVKYYVRSFCILFHLTPITNPYYSYFAHEEARANRFSDLPKISQLIVVCNADFFMLRSVSSESFQLLLQGKRD